LASRHMHIQISAYGRRFMARGRIGEMNRLASSIIVLSLALVPSVARAQASITGLVKDTSGAVLPGVTVEASSPVLIEKVRTGVSDGTGQYTIVDLRPGTYAVTFTLSGFNPVKREGIELTGSFAATVNAELKVGSVAETIVVTGDAPPVDVQTTKKTNVMTSEDVAALPAGRNQYSLAVLVPGVTQTSFGTGNEQDVGGVHGLEIELYSVHGSRPSDQRLMINGLTSQNLGAQAWASQFVPDMGTVAETNVEYSSGSAEAIGAGLTLNLIPKEGGNRFDQPVGRWADSDGQVVVLRINAVAEERVLPCRVVCEPEFWGSDEVDLRPQPERPRRARADGQSHCEPAPHVAGHAEEQDQLLGRSATTVLALPEPESGTGVVGQIRFSTRLDPDGHVVGPGDQSAVAGRSLRTSGYYPRGPVPQPRRFLLQSDSRAGTQ
jgi:hypothetical protein